MRNFPDMNYYIAILVALITFFIIVNVARGEEIDLSIIAQIESNGNTFADSYRGAKYGRGLHQVSEICLTEYNNYNKTNYKPKDLYIPLINTKIAKWYLNVRIPKMLKAYNISDTLNNRLWAYNAGIGRVVKGIKPILCAKTSS